MGFINIGKYEAAGNNLVAGANSLPLTYARVAGTFDVAGFDTGVGVQYFGGSSNVTLVTTKATVIDAQMQGEIAGFASGFYASYGRAPAVAAVVGGNTGNLYNSGAISKNTFNIA